MLSLKNDIKRYRLTISFILIIILFFAFGIVTVRGLFTIEDFPKTIYNHPFAVSNSSLTAALNIIKMHRSMKDLVLTTRLGEITSLLKKVSQQEQIVFQQLDIVREKIIGKEGQHLENQTRQLFKSWKPIREEAIHLFQLGNKKEAVLITKEKGADHVEKIEERIFQLTSYAIAKADGIIKNAELKHSSLKKTVLFLTLSCVCLSALIAFLATYFVAKTEKALLKEKNNLQKALDEIKTLHGILPLCSFCKKIRNDKGYWEQVDIYIHKHTQADISHSICPDCLKKNYPEETD